MTRTVGRRRAASGTKGTGRESNHVAEIAANVEFETDSDNTFVAGRAAGL